MGNFCKYPNQCGIGSDCTECYQDALAAAKAKLAYFEELSGERLVQISDDAERIAVLEKALETTEPMLRKIKQGYTAKFADCMHFTSWADHIAALLKEKE